MNHFILSDARVIYRTGTKRGKKKEFVRSFATVIITLPFKPRLALQFRVCLANGNASEYFLVKKYLMILATNLVIN